jgi:hypothetical protein
LKIGQIRLAGHLPDPGKGVIVDGLASLAKPPELPMEKTADFYPPTGHCTGAKTVKIIYLQR